MTGTAIDMAPPGQSRVMRLWALAQLGLKDVPTQDELRDYFLALLAREDFHPSADQRLAIDILQGDPLTEMAQARVYQDHYEQMQKQVEQFASQFWSIPPSDRRRQFESLNQKLNEMPLVQQRLDRLKWGLDLDDPMDQQADAPLLSILNTIKTGFVLEPLQQARFYQSNLTNIENPQGWIPILKKFKRNYPQIAQLAPDFIAKADSLLKRSSSYSHQQGGYQDGANIVSPTQQFFTSNGMYIFIFATVILTLLKGFFSVGKGTPQIANPPTQFRPIPAPGIPGVDPFANPELWERRWHEMNPNPTKDQLKTFELQKKIYQSGNKNMSRLNQKDSQLLKTSPPINTPAIEFDPMGPVNNLAGWEAQWKQLNPNPTPEMLENFNKKKQYFETKQREKLSKMGISLPPSNTSSPDSSKKPVTTPTKGPNER